MAKINWKSKEQKEQERIEKDKFKEKKFDKMTTKERNDLLERIAKDLGYIE